MIHSKLIKKQRNIFILLVILLCATAIISMGLGYASVSFDRIIPTLLQKGTIKDELILFSIRLPRIIITILAGMSLALSGAILQAITNNDLADPGIIGINSGAGVAVAIFFLYFPLETGTFTYLLPVVGFFGAFLTALFIYLFSYSKDRGLQPIKLVLTGIGVSIALSGLMVVLISSSERRKVDFIAQWLSGSIWGADWPFIIAILPWLLILIPFTFLKSNRLNLLQLDDSIPIGVGMRIDKERFILLFSAVALAAASVSVSGGIAFIGLIAPHLAKTLVGPRHQLSLPITILLGGWLLLLADTIGRNILEPDGIPAGIMVALIGAPYFVFLLMKKA
ncbi:iron ABC transporter permease [Bacillus carboniphilus]|uniref:Iron ABC transporter permease n=1 Tax=Bacillus carboniphilus TaxID=86663 RepID=A0ABY9JZ96_9BACI|nr:iron ABC transporter permease [Bacillus carboniphilus]WLR43828.1 iron ABC transporter permease [Bacillus carboniphilus]